ncbi:MAG: flavin reductase family protein [Gemmatimonadota bacterium]
MNLSRDPGADPGRDPGPVDQVDFRVAMSRLAAGVSIVTALNAEGRPCGMTATAVCSVSLEPPLVLASLSNGSATLAAVEETGQFALNFLGRGEEALARRFAGLTAEKFDGVAWESGITGSPVVPDALAVCECELDRAVLAGDHTVCIGRVVRIAVNDGVPNDPLIYFCGAYSALSGRRAP